MLRGSKYTCELWSPDGLLLADLSGMAQDRRVIKSRNEADEIYWRLDLNDFETYCSHNNMDPATLLMPGYTEVRIRRGGEYISGGQLAYIRPRIRADERSIELRAWGFLALFGERYTGTLREFTATQATDIAWTLIDESQNLANGDFGITRGNVATVGTHDRTYRRTNLKDALQNLTKVQTNAFDFEFTHDKVFHTYDGIGSDRPDIIFEYPNNIIELMVPNDATDLANQVVALGAGLGDETVPVVTVDNLDAQIVYKLRQRVITTNGTDDSDNGVTDAANAALSAWALPFELPSIVVDGNKAPYFTDYGIGDRVRIRVNGYGLLEHINGMYRIEKTELNVDENDKETVRIYVGI
jgi:hypothetical protein